MSRLDGLQRHAYAWSVEYTPDQLRVIDARLAKAEADIKAGRVSEAYSDHREFTADLRSAAGKLATQEH